MKDKESGVVAVSGLDGAGDKAKVGKDRHASGINKRVQQSSADSYPQCMKEAVEYFAGQDVALEFLASVRWPEGPQCPTCGSKAHSYLRSRRIWKCRECKRQYSAKLGTVFEDSPIPLDKWMLALWLITNCKNGISSYEIARDLKITQKSAWFMLHRLREALKAHSFGMRYKLGGGEGGAPVEVDETFIGGRIGEHARRSQG